MFSILSFPLAGDFIRTTSMQQSPTEDSTVPNIAPALSHPFWSSIRDELAAFSSRATNLNAALGRQWGAGAALCIAVNQCYDYALTAILFDGFVSDAEL
jgi:hypothetical protein